MSVYEKINSKNQQAKTTFQQFWTEMTTIPLPRIYTTRSKGMAVSGKAMIILSSDQAETITTKELDLFEKEVIKLGPNFSLSYKLVNGKGKAYTKPKVWINTNINPIYNRS